MANLQRHFPVASVRVTAMNTSSAASLRTQ
jgi:hypothetical protein